MLKNLFGALCLVTAFAFSPAHAEPADLTMIYLVHNGEVAILRARVQGGESFPACFGEVSNLPVVNCYRATGTRKAIDNIGVSYGATVVQSTVIPRGRDM